MYLYEHLLSASSRDELQVLFIGDYSVLFFASEETHNVLVVCDSE